MNNTANVDPYGVDPGRHVQGSTAGAGAVGELAEPPDANPEWDDEATDRG